MKTLWLSLAVYLLTPTGVWAHGDLTQVPTSVQIIQYKTTLWLNPDDLETRNQLAMAYYLIGAVEAAEKELRYVLKTDGRDFNALDGLGIVLIRKQKYPEALAVLEKAASINEQDLMVHVHLHVVYSKMSAPEKARRAWKKALSLTANRIERRQIEKELKLVSGSK
jgi:Flp pilus assembly protein TadD